MPRFMRTQDAIEQLDAACQTVSRGRAMARHLHAVVREHGLSEVEFRLLWLLREQHFSLDQTILALQLQLSTAQVSAVVERLRRRTLIQGNPAPNDRRRQVWQILPEGQLLLDTIVESLQAEPGDWVVGDAQDLPRSNQRKDAA